MVISDPLGVNSDNHYCQTPSFPKLLSQDPRKPGDNQAVESN